MHRNTVETHGNKWEKKSKQHISTYIDIFQRVSILNLLLATLMWLILSAGVDVSLAASDWYVRPVGGVYGNEDGTSYENAWDGLKSVVWGPGGVEAGDNLYVCGLHLFPYTAKSSLTTTMYITASGTAESRITIRGDYPGDQGIVWGAHIVGGELNPEWSDEGDNTYSTTSCNTSGHFYFEDVTTTSWTLLTKVDSLQDCKDTPGSYYSPTFQYLDPLYVHCSDNGDPTDRIAAPVKGWVIDTNDQEYITFKDIDFYSRGPTVKGRHIRWEGCKLWYIPYGLRLWDNTHHIEFIDCDRAYGVGGFSFQDKKPRGEDAPHNMTIRGCYIHDIGIYRQNADAEGIGTNGVDDLTIENNEFYNCGNAFQSYPYPGSTNKNIIIRWNYIHDMHQLGGARGTGIAIGMDPPNEEDLSGNQVYGNIVANCPSKGYTSNYDLHEVVFYNNVAYNCGTSFYFNAVYRDYTGPHITLRNNISVGPKTMHLYFGSATGEGNYTIDSDYNLFYPDKPKGFGFKEKGYATYPDLSGWQAVSRTGCTLDPHSIVAKPLFVDLEDGNFHLRPDSPAIDEGVDVGLSEDFDGNPVWYGAAPDIGAYEYGSAFLKYDVNGDRKVNIQDVQACVNHISGTQDWGTRADVNGDGKVNENDVREIVNIILRD